MRLSSRQPLPSVISFYFSSSSLLSPLCMTSPQSSRPVSLRAKNSQLHSSFQLQFPHMNPPHFLSDCHADLQRDASSEQKKAALEKKKKKILHNFKWGNTQGGKITHPLALRPPFLYSPPLWFLWNHTAFNLGSQLVARFRLLKALSSFKLRQWRSHRAFPSLHLSFGILEHLSSVWCVCVCVCVRACQTKLRIKVCELVLQGVLSSLKWKQSERGLMLDMSEIEL